MARKVLHVAPDGNQKFAVKTRGCKRARAVGTQGQAISAARGIAARSGSRYQIIVHNRAGQFVRSILIG